MMIDNKYWKDRAIQLEKQTHQSSKKSYQKLIPVFNKAQKEIQAKIDLWLTRIADNNEVSLDKAKEMLDNKELKDFKMSLTEYINYGMDNALNQRWMKELENASARVHIDRLEQLKLNIQAEALKLFGTEDKTLTDSIKEAYNERYDINNYIVQKGLGIGFDVANIDQEKLDKLISKPWASDGRNFSNRLWQSKEQMVNNLYNQTVRLSLGGSLKDAIDSMTRYVGREIKNKKYAAQRLIQTEMSYFASEAQKESYKDLGLDKYEIVATLDNKTSNICQEMDGKVYDMKAYQSGITAPPFHPNCRSTTCPYFNDEFTVGEMRKAKDILGNTYKVPADMTYKEWKAKQDENKVKNSIDNIVSIPNEYKVNEHKKEIEHAHLIQKELGGKIQMLVEDGKTVTADMVWNDKLWEIKAVSSDTSIDNAIRHGLKQIASNPGGIILNIEQCKLNEEEIVKCIKDRLNRSKIDIKELKVILVRDKSVYQQLKIQKEEITPSTKTGANSISSNKKDNIKSLESQEISEALEFYVSGEGMYINQHLAGLFEKDGGIWTNDDERILELLRKATQDNIKQKTLYRSVDISAVLGKMSDIDYENLMDMLIYGDSSIKKADAEIFKKKLKEVIGKEIYEPRFMSTTKDKEIALNWGDFTGSDKPIVLELELKQGVKGVDLKRFDVADDPQKEVLLKDGLTYKIKGYEVVDGQLVFKTEIKDNNLLQNDLKNDKINNNIDAISGALDKFSPEADQHAKTYYASIRNRQDDAYLEVIAEKSKIDIADIKKIKDYIFNDKHNLKTGYKRFDEDYEMAESWQRLSDKNMEILPQDIILLKHELLERQYEQEGYSHEEAHKKANLKYNYEDYYK